MVSHKRCRPSSAGDVTRSAWVSVCFKLSTRETQCLSLSLIFSRVAHGSSDGDKAASDWKDCSRRAETRGGPMAGKGSDKAEREMHPSGKSRRACLPASDVHCHCRLELRAHHFSDPPVTLGHDPPRGTVARRSSRSRTIAPCIVVFHGEPVGKSCSAARTTVLGVVFPHTGERHSHVLQQAPPCSFRLHRGRRQRSTGSQRGPRD